MLYSSMASGGCRTLLAAMHQSKLCHHGHSAFLASVCQICPQTVPCRFPLVRIRVIAFKTHLKKARIISPSQDKRFINLTASPASFLIFEVICTGSGVQRFGICVCVYGAIIQLTILSMYSGRAYKRLIVESSLGRTVIDYVHWK